MAVISITGWGYGDAAETPMYRRTVEGCEDEDEDEDEGDIVMQLSDIWSRGTLTEHISSLCPARRASTQEGLRVRKLEEHVVSRISDATKSR